MSGNNEKYIKSEVIEGLNIICRATKNKLYEIKAMLVVSSHRELIKFRDRLTGSTWLLNDNPENRNAALIFLQVLREVLTERGIEL